MLHPIGIFTVAAVGRPPARLRIGGAPRLRSERPEKRRGVKGPRPHFEVIGLVNHATLIGPESMEGEDEFLEGHEQSNRLGAVDVEKMESEANRNR